MRFKLVFFTLVALGIPAAIFAQSAQGENSSGLKNAVILIIRHAEKGDDGHGLSSRGDARAKAYASYFKNFTIDGQAVKLDDIFASKDSRVSHRPLLTAEPTAEALGLKINDRFKNNQFNELVDEIKRLKLLVDRSNALTDQMWERRVTTDTVRAVAVVAGRCQRDSANRLRDIGTTSSNAKPSSARRSSRSRVLPHRRRTPGSFWNAPTSCSRRR